MNNNNDRREGSGAAMAQPSGSPETDPTASLHGEDEQDLEAGNEDLTHGQTPAQIQADDETRSPEEEGGDDPLPDR